MSWRHFAGLKGTKVLHVGHDASAYEYTTINAAVTAAQANDTIIVHPGTHTLIGTCVIAKPLRMVGVGFPTVTCASDLAADMFQIELVAQAAAVELFFEGINFVHGDDDLDVFDLNNTNVGQTMTVTFSDCSIKVYDEAATGNAIDWNHATTGQIMKVNILGKKYHQINCVDIVPGNAGDRLVMDGVYASENGNASAVITSAAQKAMLLEFRNVAFKTATKALTGGHSDQTVRAYLCSTESVGTCLVTGDLAGSQTETVIVGNVKT